MRNLADRVIKVLREHEKLLLPAIRQLMAEAWDEGQKSGMRHADRQIAAAEIGRPDLPGPSSTNPYRTT